MPRRRNLLGHLTNSALRRQAQIERGLTNVERAPVRAEQVFVTPEEARRKRNRLYQNYFAGPSPVDDLASSGGVMMAFVDFAGADPTVYFVKYQGGEWTLISTHTEGVSIGADGGSPSTPSYAVKAPSGNYILSLDMFMDTYPYFNFLSDDGGITWTEIFEDVDAVDDGTTQSRDGAIWGFIVDGTGPSKFRIYRDGVLKYTAPGADTVYSFQHIAAHPTNANYVACAGYHFIVQPGPNDTIPWVVATADGGSNWAETELPDTRMSVNTSWEHLNLTFLASGRLVYLTMHETSGIDGETGPDGLRIWYADPPFTSWTEVNESSLWDLAGDEDWEGGPLTGGLNGDSKLFFAGHSTSGGTDNPRVFMSEDEAESWVELPAPPHKIAGICYDESVLYIQVDEPQVAGAYLLKMENPSPTGEWVDVSAGIPVAAEFPYTIQGIWRV